MIQFNLNGKLQRLSVANPNSTLLDYLREIALLRGTKEGCNEGDCGACTVMVTSNAGGHARHRAVNSCILLLPQLQGKSVCTVEGVSSPEGELHPVQEQMISSHGSQCGFCTPGIIMSLVCAHLNRERDHDLALAGNLCRCTGYAPIITAADKAASQPVPEWFSETTTPELPKLPSTGNDDFFLPEDIDELADWYIENPDARLVAGATDVGLWITKKLMDLEKVCFIGAIPELSRVSGNDRELVVGASVTVEDFGRLTESTHPGMKQLIRRFGSQQVRNSATVGGNIANGSPIGDLSPALIAIGARLVLRRGHQRRWIALEDFFLDYGVQDIEPGEFVEAIRLPLAAPDLRCYKISKRFDQDISAVCGCFNITIADDLVENARIAFGGMAATPSRARTTESALTGRPWTATEVNSAGHHLATDFAPISDMRASAAYRLQIARNLLHKCYLDSSRDGISTVYNLEVAV